MDSFERTTWTAACLTLALISYWKGYAQRAVEEQRRRQPKGRPKKLDLSRYQQGDE